MGSSSLNQVLRGVVLLLVGAGLVVFAVLLLVRVLPDGDGELRAYEGARQCREAPSGPAGCLWGREFTVVGTELTNSRSRPYSAVLVDADGGEWETFYASRGPVLAGLEEGDRVTGTVWRGRLTEVAFEGRTQQTQDAPHDRRVRALVGALVVVPSGVLLAVAGAWRLVRRSCSGPTRGMVATQGLAVALFFVGLFSPVLAGERAESLWLLAVWLPLAAVAVVTAWVFAVHRGEEGAQAESV